MQTRCPTTALKLAKPISKGNCTWRKVNKLANRLAHKGVPASIVDIVDSTDAFDPTSLASLNF